jgi:hypothetical protein
MAGLYGDSGVRRHHGDTILVLIHGRARVRSSSRLLWPNIPVDRMAIYAARIGWLPFSLAYKDHEQHDPG